MIEDIERAAYVSGDLKTAALAGELLDKQRVIDIQEKDLDQLDQRIRSLEYHLQALTEAVAEVIEIDKHHWTLANAHRAAMEILEP